MADDVEVKFGATLDDLLAGVERAKASIETVGGSVDKLREGFSKLAEVAGVALSIEGFKSFVESMAQLGEHTERTMAILGASADTVATLNAVAAATGTSADGLVHAFARLQVGLAQADAGSGRVKAALDAMGISAKQFQVLRIDEQAAAIATKFAAWADGAQKTAIAQALLGRSGADLIPFLNQGAEGFARYSALVKELLPSQEEFTKLAADTAREISTLHLAMTGFAERIFSALQPAISAAVQWMTNFLKNIKSADIQKALNEIIDISVNIFQKIEAMLGKISSAIETVVTWLDKLGGAISQFNRGLGELGRIIEAGARGDLHFDFSPQVKASTAAMDPLIDRLTMADRAAERLKISLRGAFSMPREDGSQATGGEGGKPQAPALDLSKPHKAGADKAARDRAKTQLEELDGEIKAEQQALAIKTEVWNQSVKQFSLTEQQRFGLVEQATEKEYQAELALLQKELDIQGLKPSQIQAIDNKIEALQGAHNLKMIKIDGEAVAAMQAEYQKYFGAISSAFNSQLSGCCLEQLNSATQ